MFDIYEEIRSQANIDRISKQSTVRQNSHLQRAFDGIVSDKARVWFENCKPQFIGRVMSLIRRVAEWTP
ncbi:MAG: hypothetical protein KDJ38_19665, partial [Gammaproteobacteria bacterium]|nr:hypothetical protein [Gammaproteobacteria bacterium]